MAMSLYANVRKSGDHKPPPTQVPEYELFSLMQRQRRALVNYLDTSTNESIDSIFRRTLCCALKKPDFDYSGWQRDGHGTGRYTAPAAELRIDVQSGEVLWRNDELKPVPDSMTQFADFETIFGRESLHCGLVSRQQHRHWVHVVGTEFDLMEWDAPTAKDQGVGAPAPPVDSTQSAELEKFCFQGNAGCAGCWQCANCTMYNCDTRATQVMTAAMRRTLERRPQRCNMCETPRGQGPPPPETKLSEDDVVYGGVMFTRKFDPYSGEPMSEKSEQWVSDLLSPIINSLYPVHLHLLHYCCCHLFNFFPLK